MFKYAVVSSDASFILDSSMFVVEKITDNLYHYDSNLFFTLGLKPSKDFYYCVVKGNGNYISEKEIFINDFLGGIVKCVTFTLTNTPSQYTETVYRCKQDSYERECLLNIEVPAVVTTATFNVSSNYLDWNSLRSLAKKLLGSAKGNKFILVKALEEYFSKH